MKPLSILLVCGAIGAGKTKAIQKLQNRRPCATLQLERGASTLEGATLLTARKRKECPQALSEYFRNLQEDSLIIELGANASLEDQMRELESA